MSVTSIYMLKYIYLLLTGNNIPDFDGQMTDDCFLSVTATSVVASLSEKMNTMTDNFAYFINDCHRNG